MPDLAPDLETVGPEDGASLAYQEWIISEALKIHSDKCTFAKDWNVWCCYEHDLACHFKKDPRSAFQLQSWALAVPLSRKEADRRFWRCNRRQEPSAWGRFRSDLRYLGVRIGAFLPPY
jgi:hypothetical protein